MSHHYLWAVSWEDRQEMATWVGRHRPGLVAEGSGCSPLPFLLSHHWASGRWLPALIQANRERDLHGQGVHKVPEGMWRAHSPSDCQSPEWWRKIITQGTCPYKVGNIWLKSPFSISWQSDFLQGAARNGGRKDVTRNTCCVVPDAHF